MHHQTWIFIALILVSTVSTVFAADLKTAWEEVEKAKQDGLPQTAIEKLKPIIEKAIVDKNLGLSVRAVCEKVVMEGNIQGNKAEEKITMLEKEIDGLPAEIRPLLKVVLARWYWHYFQQNNWRFLNRTATQGLDEKDFTTWDLPKLFAKIGSLYEEALKDEETLKKTPLSTLKDFLEPGNQPAELRPTVFDFFAYQLLEFYTSGEQAAAKPQDAFEMPAGSAALGSADEFLAWVPTTPDTDSPKLKALQLFQKIMKFHKEKGDDSAFLDADLHRLRWARSAVVGDGASDRFLNQLKVIAKEKTKDPLSAVALFMASRELFSIEKRAEAHEIAAEGANRFPNTAGGSDCTSMLRQIEAKHLEVKTDRVSGRPEAEIKIEYTNIGEVNFRLVARDWHSLFQKNRSNPNYPDWQEFENALSAKPEQEWTVSLPQTKDYMVQKHVVTMPTNAEPGFYFLLASGRKDFEKNRNSVKVVPVWISSLALVSRTRWGKVEGLVVDNLTGEPIGGATVEGHVYKYDRGWRLHEKTTTAPDGTFQMPASEDYVYCVVQNKGETLIVSEGLYNYGAGPIVPNRSVFFFTDRGLYRPGQTIRFKGIVVAIDKEKDRYEIVPNLNVEVALEDSNGQEVTKIKVLSNDFGSFSGTFTAPTNRLTGAMRIVARSPEGSTVVRIEEYKRPKFKVALEVPSEGGKLGESVTVKGEAISYSGAAIDGAAVKFRVVREVHFPFWCWWRRFIYPSNSQEIAHGSRVTDKNGRFEVSFVAKPDLTIPEKDQPIFTFEVNADVTDGTGETRSQGRGIRLGYVAMDLVMNAPSWLQSNQPFGVTINTATLDGKGITAAGSLLVHSLKAPDKPVRPEYADKPDPDRPDKSNPATWEEGPVVAEESFQTSLEGNATAKFTLKPGAYRVVATSRDRFNKPIASRLDLTVIDPAATKLEIKIPHLFLVQNSSPEVGETFRALWGTGYDTGRAYIEVEHRRKVLQAFWTKESATQHFIEIPVKEEMRGGFTVRVTQVRENRCFLQNMKVNVPWSNKRLNLSFGHFTSKMAPGQKETWSITISGPEAEKSAIEMAAALYDASLDAFYPFSWMDRLNIFRSDDCPVNANFTNRLQAATNLFENWNSNWGFSDRIYPQLPQNIIINFMGYEFARYRTSKSKKMLNEADGPTGGGGPRGAPSSSLGAAPMRSMMAAAQMESEKKSDSFKDSLPAANKPAQPPQPDLDKVSARANLNETAFFFPQLTLDEKGTVTMNFTMPEALTTWKFLGFAHGKKGQSGKLTGETITQKDLMVQPNPPRFLREGDELVFTAKVTNLSEGVQKGKVRFSLRDPGTEQSKDAAFSLQNPDQEFEVPAKESRSFGWRFKVPDGPGLIAFKVVGATEKLSDGEEGVLPVLSRRIFVTESVPLHIKGPGRKGFKLPKLIDSGKSDTLITQTLTVQITSNPAWYAVQALPYLMEFPHECSEQLFNRVYANTLARFIAMSDPRIRKVFDAWKADEPQGGKALLSNLEKNEQLKSILLMETPWVREAKSETEAKHNIGVLFDDNRLNNELSKGKDTLSKMQLSDGSWPWFPGGPGNPFITLYIVTGFGRLRHLGTDIEIDMAVKALDHLDRWIDETYREIVRYGDKDENHLSSTIALYFYGRSFFLKDREIPAHAKEAVDYFLGQGKKFWLQLNCRQSQGHLALGMSRFGDKETPQKIVASLRERSVTDEELGRFWRDTELSWWWYHAPIETQAVMIEVFDEIAQDPATVEDCKVWLLKQKQTQDWKTTKATADAIYALLLKGTKLLASDKLVAVTLGGVEVKPEKVEAGTGFYEKRYEGAAVKPAMGEVSLVKEDQGIAWGGLHWQYLEDMSKVTPHETNLKLKKTLFIKLDSPKGPVLTAVQGKVKTGDLLVVRIELRTDRDMEYLHMKDQRGSGMEPVDVLSMYRYQDGLAYYQSTKDTASHFFIDYLPKGTYVFEYNLRVQHKGRYQTGMTEIQCMYAPEFNSHSESFLLDVD